jgi:hypothetical protein
LAKKDHPAGDAHYQGGSRAIGILKATAVGISLVASTALAACGTSVFNPDDGARKHSTVTYSYDSSADAWIESISTVGAQDRGGAAQNASGNTLVVQLRADTPIQEINVEGGFVIGGSDPILDIDGDPDESGGGALRIGTLTMDAVDGRRLQIRDTQVVSANMTGVAAHDNELELSFQKVTVVFVQQGASNILSLKDSRLDRIRILGVGGGVDTHLERLTITRSAFVGTMRVEDAMIDSLVLKNVSLED